MYHHLKRIDSPFVLNAEYFLKGMLLTLDFLIDQSFFFHRIHLVTKSYFPIGSFWLTSKGICWVWVRGHQLPPCLCFQGALAYFRGMDDNYPEDNYQQHQSGYKGVFETLEKIDGVFLFHPQTKLVSGFK